MTLKTSQSVLLQLLGSVILATGLFFLLTSSIPLHQWGWIDVEFHKKICVKILRISVLLTGLSFLLWCWRWPDSFQELWFVKAINKLTGQSLVKWVGCLYLIYVIQLISVGWVRHLAIETRAFDIGIFAQALWTTTQGDFLYSSIKGGICLLGDHMSPLLLFLVPFYALWPDPLTLVIVQVLVSALCLVFLSILVWEKTKNPFWVFVFSIAYFFYFPSRSALHEDFHPEVLVDPLLILSFIFLEKKKWVGFVLSLFVATLAKENMYGISFMFGLYILCWKPQKKLGISLVVVSLIVFFFVVKWAIPTISNAPYLYQGNYWHLLSGSPVEAIKVIFNADVFEYIMKVFLPFLFLPFFHLPTLMLTFPVLFQNLLSNNDAMRSFGYHYTTGLAPFVFISSLYGLNHVLMRFSWLGRNFRWAGMLFLFVALLRSGPSEYFYFTDSLGNRSEHRDHIREQLASIPQEASVLTHNNFIPQLINRKEVYQFEYNETPTKVEQSRSLNPDFVIFDREFLEPKSLSLDQTLKQFQNTTYQIVHQNDDFYILKRTR